MPRISSGTLVAALTLAALAAVGVLAAQASGSAPSRAAGARGGGPSAPSSGASPSARAKVARATYALPPGSGTGTGARVVYSLDQDRVWLVDSADQVSRAFAVTPGTVDPAPGRYTVVSRALSGTGGDGVPIEHVVRFADTGGVVIGFSSAQDGSLPTAPDPARKTGGVRERRADGAALWQAAPLGTRVVVVR
jgi:hypothetical protein